MRWIVGLDLERRSAGALQLVRWLARESRAAGGERFAAVHVLEEEHLEVALRYHHLDDVLASARSALEESLRHEGVDAILGDLQLVQGPDAAESLREAAAAQGADALVVGRAAPGAAGLHIVRLGRVARRLLRRTPVPVVVVPPDVRAEALGDGPLVALTLLDARSARTAAFAAGLAGALGRPLALVHVIPPSVEQAAPYFPADVGAKIAAEQRARGEEALAKWVSASGLAPDLTAVLQGNPVDAALSFAESHRAPMLLVGARPLRGVTAVLASGTASVLASVARVPVVVVPSA